jgi:hypothetical protein
MAGRSATREQSCCANAGLTFASSCAPALHASTVLQSSPPESDQPLEPAPLGTLLQRALHVCARHALLFGAVTVAVLLLQRAVYAFFPGELGANFVAAAFTPIIAVTANIAAAADLRATSLSLGELFDLALTRLWAVIVLDLAFSWLLQVAFNVMFAPSLGDALVGLIGFILAATLVFADVYASVEPQPNLLRTLPLAIMRSVGLSWQDGNIARVFSLASLLMLLFVGNALLGLWIMTHHVRDAVFLANVPLGTVVQAPLSALFTAVYLDCLARERRRAA